MPKQFSPATAEQVVSAVEAVLVANQSPCEAQFVASFADIPVIQAESALELAVDLGLLEAQSGQFSPMSPLCRLLVTPDESQRAAALRVVLETYEPFTVFRERLASTGMMSESARQTKVVLDLDAHHDSIKDTLISLGTYARALEARGGGHYASADAPLGNQLNELANACGMQASAEQQVRVQIGNYPSDRLPRDEVLLPIADALLCANSGDGRGAVVRAGNAVESFLEALSRRQGVNVSRAFGINAKLEQFRQAGTLPRKVVNAGKYLGHIRNAADHGVDPDVNAAWTVRSETGVEYVFVACSFIRTMLILEDNDPPSL